jgi:integrase
MNPTAQVPIGVPLSADIEYREGRPKPYKARVRWVDPATHHRRSVSESVQTSEEAEGWIDLMRDLSRAGVDPQMAVKTLAEYGEANMSLAVRGLEKKTLDPYMAGWSKRVVPDLGHLAIRMITYGVVDRAVHGWISDGCGKSTIKNSLAILVRILEQAVRDGIVEHNRARITGWQSEYQLAEDELDNPRSLALPNWDALELLAAELVARSADQYPGWGEVVEFTACTAARIGETSGVRRADIDHRNWIWNVRRQTTTGPGGLIDKGTKGKRAREVPIIQEIRPLVERRLNSISDDPMARLFTGPRGGRISTAVLRDATHWDEVVAKLGYDYLRRHDLRHTGLTWMADAGVSMHVLRKIAGHGAITTTQRYLHPNRQSITDAGQALSAHLGAS